MTTPAGETKTTSIPILIVDPTEQYCELAKARLSPMNYEVTTATSSQAALELFEKHSFPIVICNFFLDDLSGLDVLRITRGANPTTEVIMLGGHVDSTSVHEAICLGAYYIMLKPLAFTEIDMIIQRALEKGELKAIAAMSESSRAIFSPMNVNDLVLSVMEILTRSFSVDVGSIMLFDDENKLRITASTGLSADIVRDTCLELGERIAGRAAQENQPFMIRGRLEDSADFANLHGNPDIHSAMIYPIACYGKVLGVLNLGRSQNSRGFADLDLKSISVFASQLGQAINNARLYHKLEGKIKQLEDAHRELKNAQDNLLHSERLATIGKLASGIAHELNNPLTGIMGYTQLVHGQLSKDPQNAEFLQIVLKEARRCKKIVEELLTIARKKELSQKDASVTDLIGDILQMMKLKFKEFAIEIETVFPESPVRAFIDSDKIKQILVNLLSNAIHALESREDSRKIRVLLECHEQMAVIRIEDNGPGIPEDILPRIFEPFFTTKDVGKGTGLGLNISHGIARQHGGDLRAESDAGHGACFILEIPTTSEEAPAKEAAPAPAEAPADGEATRKKRILIIDDEETIARLATMILAPLGADIVCAYDGAIGVEEIKNNSFDVIVCDFLLPKMRGNEVFREAIAHDPGLRDKFLYVTGSVSRDEISDFFRVENIPYLLKPFDNEELFELVKKKLG